MHLLLPLLCFRQRNTLPAILEENFVFRYVFTHKDPKTSSGDSGLFERCGNQPQRYAHTFFHQGATVETALVNAEPRFLSSQPWVLDSNWGIRKRALRTSMRGV